VVVDGHLLRGRHGGVGEIVAFDHVDGVGTADGRKELAPGSALATLAPEQVEGRAVLELAAAGDEDARRIASRVGAVLARIVSVLGSMFDPEPVVIAGAISAGVDEVVATARRALPTGLDLPAPDLVMPKARRRRGRYWRCSGCSLSGEGARSWPRVRAAREADPSALLAREGARALRGAEEQGVFRGYR